MDLTEHLPPDTVPLHYMTVVTYLDTDGTACMGTFTSDGLPCWEALGMATLARDQFRGAVADMTENWNE